MRYLLVALAVGLGGCLKPMSRAEQIAAIKECREAGLGVRIVFGEWGVMRIDCAEVPK